MPHTMCWRMTETEIIFFSVKGNIFEECVVEECWVAWFPSHTNTTSLKNPQALDKSTKAGLNLGSLN